MARPIDALRANFRSYAKASHYAVNIFGPVSSPLGAGTEYYIVGATMPGRNMVTSDIKYGLNLPEKKVYSSAYSPCTLTFMCDGGMGLYRWFMDWQDLMQDPLNGRVAYSNDYIGTVELKTFGLGGSRTHTHKLEGAFPENLGDIQFTADSAEIATFDVTFAYRHYTNQPGIFSPGGGAFGGGLVSAAAAFGGAALSVAGNLNLGPVNLNVGSLFA
jgi:hypothetical protein